MNDLATALDEYRHAEAQHRYRTTAAAGPSATDNRALAFIYAGADNNTLRTPKELAAYLHISSASVTTLVDRLSDAGFITRIAHPTDRRRIRLTPTHPRIAPSTASGLVGRMHTLTEQYSDHDAHVVTGFLHELTALIADETARTGTVAVPGTEKRSVS